MPRVVCTSRRKVPLKKPQLSFMPKRITRSSPHHARKPIHRIPHGFAIHVRRNTKEPAGPFFGFLTAHYCVGTAVISMPATVVMLCEPVSRCFMTKRDVRQIQTLTP